MRWRESIEVVDAYLRGDDAALVDGIASSVSEEREEDDQGGGSVEREGGERHRLYLEIGSGSVCAGLARKCVAAGNADFLSFGDDLEAFKSAHEFLDPFCGTWNES